eukprot:CCRYP_001801-RA/>CCRYP_001801-RA protein AED:0.23 eAED:0.57 QI:0/0/0/1/0/0/2/0/101
MHAGADNLVMQSQKALSQTTEVLWHIKLCHLHERGDDLVEIRITKSVARNKFLTKLQSICHCAQYLKTKDTFLQTTVYNSNKSVIDWVSSCTDKHTQHTKL